MADKQQDKPVKVWVLTNAPSPYQVELFSALGADPRVMLTVRFMRKGYEGMPASDPAGCGFDYAVMTGHGLGRKRDELRWHPQAIEEARSGDWDIYVLSGMYTSLTFQRVARLLQKRNAAWAAWLEQPWPVDYRPAWAERWSARWKPAAWLRERLLTGTVRDAPGVLAIGTAAVEAYSRYGVSPDRVFNMPYHCNVERFENVNVEQTDRVREDAGLRGKTVFLYAGMLVPRKGVDVLIKAFNHLAGERDDVALVLLGKGSQGAVLERSVDSAIADRVVFAGQLGQQELPAHYGAADVFVFPSRHDGWAVVLNEACGAGLPVVATQQTGAARDLVEEDVNGFLFERDDVESLYGYMRTLAEDVALRERMGRASREVIRKYDLPHGVDRFIEAVIKIREHAIS
jgi:glycosyltransferase involved in cell wall biosynthesis